MLKIIFKMIGCFIPIVMLAGFASAKKYDGVTIFSPWRLLKSKDLW